MRWNWDIAKKMSPSFWLYDHFKDEMVPKPPSEEDIMVGTGIVAGVVAGIFALKTLGEEVGRQAAKELMKEEENLQEE